jgi:hypothetical protein
MAVFADSNHQRLGINRAAASLGLRPPDDVTVVGFDGLPFMDRVTPRLTTVCAPLADMTALVASMVPQMLRQALAEAATEFVVRDSGGLRRSRGRAVECGVRGSAHLGEGVPRGTEPPRGRPIGQNSVSASKLETCADWSVPNWCSSRLVASGPHA